MIYGKCIFYRLKNLLEKSVKSVKNMIDRNSPV